MDTIEISGRLLELQEELRALRAELALRRPVAWRMTDAGTAVLCSDGAIFWQDDTTNDWGEASPVPGTPAATAGATT